MALSFTEDLDAFFDTPGFTVPVVFGATTGVGYFESPNEIIADGVVLTTDYAVVVKTSDFSAVTNGSAMTVEGLRRDNQTRKHPGCDQDSSHEHQWCWHKDLSHSC